MTVTEKVRTALIQNVTIKTGDVLVVGLSGGADSVTLLHCLCSLKRELGFDLYTVHVHHGLRGEEADRDRDFAEQFCRDLNVPFECYTYDVPTLAREQGKGLEEMGRELRYKAFNEVASRFPCAYIVTAHTADDHIETVLLHLCRGCGLHGLTGLPARRANVIRPLIDCRRSEIEAYCQQYGLSYVTDSTNADNTYTRNRVRHQLVPLLSEIHPNAEQAVWRLAEQAKQTERYLQTVAEPIFREMMTEDPCRYRREPLLSVDVFLQKFILQELMREQRIAVSENHVVTMCDAVENGGTVILPNAIAFEVSRSFITLSERQAAGVTYCTEILTREEYEQKLNISKELFKNCCDYDMICGDVRVRNRIEGDTYRPVGRGCKKTLRKLFNENEVPKPMRATVPLVCDDRGIAIVGGFGCDERVAITPNTVRVLVLKKTEE